MACPSTVNPVRQSERTSKAAHLGREGYPHATYRTQRKPSTMRISPFAASMFLVSATLGASARRGVASAFVAPSSSTTSASVRRQFGGSAAVLAAEKNGGGNKQQQKQKQGGKFRL